LNLPLTCSDASVSQSDYCRGGVRETTVNYLATTGTRRYSGSLQCISSESGDTLGTCLTSQYGNDSRRSRYINSWGSEVSNFGWIYKLCATGLPAVTGDSIPPFFDTTFLAGDSTGPSNAPIYAWYGSLESGATVIMTFNDMKSLNPSLYPNNRTQTFTATGDNSDRWTLTNTNRGSGIYVVELEAEDSAGNVAPNTYRDVFSLSHSDFYNGNEFGFQQSVPVWEASTPCPEGFRALTGDEAASTFPGGEIYIDKSVVGNDAASGYIFSGTNRRELFRTCAETTFQYCFGVSDQARYSWLRTQPTYTPAADSVEYKVCYPDKYL